MSYDDRIKDTTTTTGTGNVTVSGTPANRFFPFSGLTIGGQYVIVIEGQGASTEIEESLCTILSATTFSRDSVIRSSNSNALVNFSAGIKDVFVTLSATQARKFVSSDDIAFAAAVPLNSGGIRYMPQQTTVPSGFTVAALPVKNSVVYIRIVADGATVPTFTGYKEAGGSSGYLNTAGVVNIIQFFYDGYDYWYLILQAATPAPIATAITLTGPASGVISTASTNFNIGVSAVGGDITGTVVVTPSDGGAGGTFTPTSISLNNSTPTGTFTYTGTSLGAKTISVSNNGGLTNPSGITYTVNAAAAAPSAPTMGTAVQTGSTTANVPFTVGSDGGAAITSTVAEAYIAGVATGITASLAGSGSGTIAMTGLTASTTYTFKAHSINSVGPGALSVASNSITTSSGAAYPRFTGLVATNESGTGPYTYTGAASSWGAVDGGVSIKKLLAGVDGSIDFTVQSGATGMLMGLSTSSTLAAYSTWNYGVYRLGAGSGYNKVGGGGSGGLAYTSAAGDVVRFTRTGTNLTVSLQAGGTGSFVLMDTYAMGSSPDLYAQFNPDGNSAIISPTFTGFA